MTIMNVRFYKGLAMSGRSNEFAAGVYPTSDGEDVEISATSAACTAAPAGTTIARIAVVGGNVKVDRAASVTAATGDLFPAGSWEYRPASPGDVYAGIAASE